MQEQQNVSLPRCAVVIATHNNAHWLMGAIESAARQDYPEKVIYVIDDCSTDNTLETIEKHPGIVQKLPGSHSDDVIEFTRLFVFEQTYINYYRLKTNKGPSFARNVAINDALNSCHMIAILDADDQFLQKKISKCVARIMSDPQTIGSVYCDYIHLNMNGAISYESKWSYDLMKLRQESIIHSGAVYNALALKWVKEQCGFYYHPEMFTCEDFALNRLLARRWLSIHIPEPLTLVRVHNNSSVNYRNDETWKKNYQMAMSIQI